MLRYFYAVITSYSIHYTKLYESAVIRIIESITIGVELLRFLNEANMEQTKKFKGRKKLNLAVKKEFQQWLLKQVLIAVVVSACLAAIILYFYAVITSYSIHYTKLYD